MHAVNWDMLQLRESWNNEMNVRIIYLVFTGTGGLSDASSNSLNSGKDSDSKENPPK